MPRHARGFSLFSAYQKATTKNVVANFILPLILHALEAICFSGAVLFIIVPFGSGFLLEQIRAYAGNTDAKHGEAGFYVKLTQQGSDDHGNAHCKGNRL